MGGLMTKGTLEIEKYIVISTCHIPEALNEVLSSDGTTQDEYGHWLYVPEYNYGEVEDGYDGDNLEDYKFLNPLFDLARKHGCVHIRLDSDGPEVEGLEVYSW
jgi:hypothetical protein